MGHDGPTLPRIPAAPKRKKLDHLAASLALGPERHFRGSREIEARMGDNSPIGLWGNIGGSHHSIQKVVAAPMGGTLLAGARCHTELASDGGVARIAWSRAASIDGHQFHIPGAGLEAEDQKVIPTGRDIGVDIEGPVVAIHDVAQVLKGKILRGKGSARVWRFRRGALDDADPRRGDGRQGR